MAVPFQAKVKASDTAEAASDQLQAVINHYTSEGWEFVQLGSVSIEVKAGCLAGLFGAQSSFAQHDQIIFRRAY